MPTLSGVYELKPSRWATLFLVGMTLLGAAALFLSTIPWPIQILFVVALGFYVVVSRRPMRGLRGISIQHESAVVLLHFLHECRPFGLSAQPWIGPYFIVLPLYRAGAQRKTYLWLMRDSLGEFAYRALIGDCTRIHLFLK